MVARTPARARSKRRLKGSGRRSTQSGSIMRTPTSFITTDRSLRSWRKTASSRLPANTVLASMSRLSPTIASRTSRVRPGSQPATVAVTSARMMSTYRLISVWANAGCSWRRLRTWFRPVAVTTLSPSSSPSLS